MAVVRHFSGRDFLVPAGVSVNDFSGGEFASGSALNNLIIVGESLASLGGGPAEATDIADEAKAIKITSPSQAKTVLRGGLGLEAVLAALNPSTVEQGPGQVLFLRITKNATKAQAFLKHTGTDTIQLDGRDYGSYLSALVAVADGSNGAPTKKVTITVNVNGVNDVMVLDNIDRQMFSIQYAGAGTGTMEITASAITLTLNAAPTNFYFADYPTIGAMINKLKDFGLTNSLTVTSLADNLAYVTATLDLVTAGADIKTSSVKVRATTAAIIDVITLKSEYVKASLKAGATYQTITNGTATVTGGSNGATPTFTEYNNALSILEKLDVQAIVVDDIFSGTYSGVAAAYFAHCHNMSAPGAGKERRCYSGPKLAETEANARINSISLNSEDGSYCFPGPVRYDANGIKVNQPSFVTAAMVAAVRCGALRDDEPSTNKSLNILGLETSIPEADKADCIKDGLLIISAEDGVFKVVRGITTSQTSNLILIEESMIWSAKSMSKRMRDAVMSIVKGHPGDAKLITKARGAVISTGLTFVSEGKLVADPNDPTSKPFAFDPSQLRVSGDAILIDWDGIIASPVNFAFIKNHFSILISL